MRWISFLPLALLASLPAGSLAYYFFLWPSQRWDLQDFLPWLASGFVSGATFLGIGIRIAPEAGAPAKWLLVVPMLVMGVISALGGAIANDNDHAGLTGLALALAGIGAARMSPEELLRTFGGLFGYSKPPAQ